MSKKPEIVKDDEEEKEVAVVPEQEKEIQEVSPVAMTPSGLIELAVRGGADIDKLEKLIDLKNREEEREAKKQFIKAMSLFRGKCPTIAKDGGVDFTSSKGRTNYKYSSLAGALDTIRPILAECGLSHTWYTDNTAEKITVTCVVTHVDGHSEQTTLSAGSDTTGNKNSIQAMGSTVSYLQRYTLFSVLGLTSSDMDNDGGEQPKQEDVTPKEVEEIETLITDTKTDITAFLAHYEISNTDQMTREIYGKAKIRLKALKQGDQK